MALKFYFLIGLASTVAPDSSLRQLHVIFRHGERAPTETYKNDPYINYTWSGGWGQLTNRGKLEMYSLGLKLRDLYSDFIPNYYFPEEVKMLSSYADRCLMSAEAVLAALFPPRDEQIWNKHLLWQPIPVHYVPRNQDNLLAMRAPCKNYDEEFSQIFNSGELKRINDENAELFSFLTQHTGEEIQDIGKVEPLYNTLEIELLHNLTLPVWTQNVSLDHMKFLAARYLESFVETVYMKRMKGGAFLQHVITSMENFGKEPMLFLYAAHDITLVNILKTLGYAKMLKPGFGASFIIEMYNSSEVSMKYRNGIVSDPEEITLRDCSSCTLEQLKKALEPVLPINWNEECG